MKRINIEDVVNAFPDEILEIIFKDISWFQIVDALLKVKKYEPILNRLLNLWSVQLAVLYHNLGHIFRQLSIYPTSIWGYHTYEDEDDVSPEVIIPSIPIIKMMFRCDFDDIYLFDFHPRERELMKSFQAHLKGRKTKNMLPYGYTARNIISSCFARRNAYTIKPSERPLTNDLYGIHRFIHDTKYEDRYDNATDFYNAAYLQYFNPSRKSYKIECRNRIKNTKTHNLESFAIGYFWQKYKRQNRHSHIKKYRDMKAKSIPVVNTSLVQQNNHKKKEKTAKTYNQGRLR